MANGNIDTIHRLAGIVETLLIDDGVESNGRFTRLAVANDELTLPPTNGNHRVYTFKSCLKWFLNGLTEDNTRCFSVERHLESVRQINFAKPVDSLAQGVDYTPKHVVVHPNAGNAVRALYHLPLFDFRGRS